MAGDGLAQGTIGSGLVEPVPSAPEFTFPPEEGRWVRDHYAAADVILEYGSGGSTVVGAACDARLMSVESDAAFADRVLQYLHSQELTDDVHLLYVDIGPTGPWGHPVSRRQSWRYPWYVQSVRRRRWYQQPDVVLVDGRFRPACLLDVVLHATRPVTVLFDDYVTRPWYHPTVERHVVPAATNGRMARFDVVPGLGTASMWIDYLRLLRHPA